MTLQRGEHSFFSEPYYCTPLAALHASAMALPADSQTWRGRIAVVAQTLPASIVGGWFCAATISYVGAMSDAVDALRRGEVDAVFDDEVTLRGYAGDALCPHAAFALRAILRRCDGARQPHAPQHR